jgi:hypothetical protein
LFRTYDSTFLVHGEENISVVLVDRPPHITGKDIFLDTGEKNFSA